jgi:hypothetical protein
MIRGGAVLLGMALALGANSLASSATIKSVPGKSGRVNIQVSGIIGVGDGDLFIRTVQQANAAGKSIESVQLNSTGGRLGEGAKLAATIKLGKLPTVVASGAVCASACFLAFAAGEQRFAGPGALIGVHKASDQGGVETKASGAASVLMARLAKELGVPSPIVARMLATPPTQIAWLDARDLRAMGVKTLGPSVQPTQVAAASESTVAPEVPAENLSPTSPPAKEAINRPGWNEFIEKAIAISAEQNQGNAILKRSCSPELKECVMAVAYELPDGRQALATVAQGANGDITRREVCENNAANTVRDCIDWDTGGKYRDVKDTSGAWVQSASE